MVAAAALVILPLNLGAANATETPAQLTLDELNLDRVFGAGQPGFLSNGFLDDFAQASALNYANCYGCTDPAFASMSSDITPNDLTIDYTTVGGGLLTDRPDRAVADFESKAPTNALGTNTYGSVGFVTVGTTSYVALITASFTGTPTDETRPGTVKLPSVIRVGVPVVPIISGFSPLPVGGYNILWSVDGVISSAGPTFTPDAFDIGQAVTAFVSDHNSNYSNATVESAPSSKVLIGIIGAPSVQAVTGLRNVGQVLTADVSGWSVYPTFQWYRNSSVLAGQTGATYLQAASDRGAKISVRLTASNIGYTTVVRSSSGAIVTGYPLLTSTPFPQIQGTPTFGTTLDADTFTWGPGTVTLHFQWYSDGKAIAGATKQDLVLGGAELNSSITVLVTGTESGYVGASRLSAPTTDVSLLHFTIGGIPNITGTLTHGDILTAHEPAWTPAVSEYIYQWYLNNEPVAGANKTTFKLPANSAGEDVHVNVIGLRPDYQAVQYSSSNELVN
jgi:hypothetical protein